ncbi:MAG: GNAT family N-acetyltransferase [Knoellia sp.]
MAIRIVRVTTLDPDQAELAEAWNEASIFSTSATMGEDNDARSIASHRAREESPNWDHTYLAAIDDHDRVVASAALAMPQRDNLQLALFRIDVTPDHRRRGIGTTMLEHLTRQAREAGRISLAAETAYPQNGTDPGEGFARRHGFDLAQTNHRNDLDVTAYSFEKPLETQGYAIETSTDDTLDEWLEDRAILQQRMSTDAPIGELDFEEEAWDAERLKGEREAARKSERSVIESVARHLGTDTLVAFSQVQVPIAEPELAYQQDTLVLREHRGHGLGAALKAANMLALRTEFPQTRTVRTWNAVENGPMIAVNEALGYRTTAIQREWQKRLA